MVSEINNGQKKIGLLCKSVFYKNILDNLYILNYEVARLRKNETYVLFADMLTAYDMVDRNGLIRMMHKIGIKSDVVKAISDIYAESESIVQIDRRTVGRFWTQRGRAQNCSLIVIGR